MNWAEAGLGMIIAASVTGLSWSFFRAASLRRRWARPVCLACSYATVGLRAGRCPECGLDADEANRRCRLALLRSLASCVAAATVLVAASDLLAFHRLPWGRFLPTTTLLLVRRHIPWIGADEELNDRLVTDCRDVIWCNHSALWDWQWRLVRATRAPVVSCDGPAMIDEVAEAISARRTTRVSGELPLLRGGTVSVAELESLQRQLGVVPLHWPSAAVVNVAVSRVDLDGDGAAEDVVLILSVPDSWWRQVWMLTPDDVNAQGDLGEPRPFPGFRLVRTLSIRLDPIGSDSDPKVLDLGRGRVLLSFCTEACRGPGVRFKGRLFCLLPPRDRADTWLLPIEGYCRTHDGRTTRLADVDWRIGSGRQEVTFTADLNYSVGRCGEEPTPRFGERSSGYRLRVVIERRDGEAPRIRRQLSGRLVAGSVLGFVPGDGVPDEVHDLWEPVSECARSVPASGRDAATPQLVDPFKEAGHGGDATTCLGLNQ